MKQRLRRKKKEVATTCETRYAIPRHAEMKDPTYVMPHNEPIHIEMKESEWLDNSSCMLPLVS